MYLSKYMGLLAGVTIYILNLLDAVNTWYAINYQDAEELSILMRYLIEKSWGYFFFVKLSYGSIVFFVMTVCWSTYRSTRIASLIVIFGYSALVTWQLSNIL
jgi:hypothetical protein